MESPHPKDLIGMRLSIARHAADLLNLQFGEITREGDKSWGELALHIQAPWRMRRGQSILTGSNDRWNPIGEIEDRDAWYQSPHPSREDCFWLKFMGQADPRTRSFETDSNPVTVVSVIDSAFGDLILGFDDGTSLEVFACGTDDEFWRLFESGKDSPHLVVELTAPIPDNGTEMQRLAESGFL